MKISVVLPTYNEKNNIVLLIKKIKEISQRPEQTPNRYEIIVVDDNSPDGTGKSVQKHFKDVLVFIRENERGLASAILHGIQHSSGEVIVVMDTDFNHDPEKIPQMVSFLEYYDLIIGSRYTVGGDMENKKRYYASYLYNVFIRMILRTQIQDNLSGFFAIQRKKLFSLPLEGIFVGYGDYFMQLLYYAWKYKFAMLEIPVRYKERFSGNSKSNLFKMFWTYSHTAFSLKFSKSLKNITKTDTIAMLVEERQSDPTL